MKYSRLECVFYLHKGNMGLTIFRKGKRVSGEAAHFEPIGGLQKWGVASVLTDMVDSWLPVFLLSGPLERRQKLASKHNCGGNKLCLLESALRRRYILRGGEALTHRRNPRRSFQVRCNQEQ